MEAKQRAFFNRQKPSFERKKDIATNEPLTTPLMEGVLRFISDFWIDDEKNYVVFLIVRCCLLEV